MPKACPNGREGLVYPNRTSTEFQLIGILIEAHLEI